MGVSKILSVLLATLLLDSVICSRVRHPGYGPAKGASASEVSSSHGRTFLNFDSSPALTHLEFDGGPSSNVHRGVHGDPVFPPKPDPSSAFDQYDYAPYAQSYPEWHQVHSYHEHDVNAAQPLWQAFDELRQTPTKQPTSARSTDAGRKTIDLSEFHPTHSFFGSMFTDSPTKTSPPVASATEASGSSADKDSRNMNTTTGEAQAVSTSVQHESHGDHGKTLQNGAPLAIESLVQQGVGITEAPTLASPTVGDKLTESRTKPSVRPEAGAFPRTTSTAAVVTKESTPTVPDVSRTTVASREPGFTVTHPNFNGNSFHSTRGVTSTATGTDSKARFSTVPASEPEDFVPRQAAAETGASPSKPGGGFAQLPTPSEAGGADEAVSTTTGRSFMNAATGSRPAHPQTSASQTEIPATQPVFKNPPPDNTSETLPSVLLESTKPPQHATSPRETPTPVQRVVFKNESSDFPTAQATTVSSAVSEIAGLARRLETTTTPASLARSTDLDGPLRNRTTAPLTRAPVRDGNQTSTVPQPPVESSTLHPTFPAVTAGVRRQATPTSSPTTTEPTRVFPTVHGVQASPAQAAPAENPAFKQTLPPSRPVRPATTASGPVTADAYVRPITQHGVHEFVPQRHRDVEDYFYHHQSGRVDDYDELRRSPCGKCQRRLHYCVQKCFVHHSCEAETKPEFTCPRINAPCMPPYKQEVDQCRHSSDCEGANHLCCLVGCSRRCVHGVPVQHWAT